jgi:two-component system alkaline phosphatase synthesis response regulator PhoP
MKAIKKFLFIDNDPLVLKYLERLFKNSFHIILTASNGKEGLKIAATEKPNLILLEVSLPEMDGIEICYELRKMQECKEVLISFYTNRKEEYSIRAGFDAGADDYILKPSSESMLLCRTSALLKRLPLFSENKLPKSFGDIQLLADQYVVINKGIKISLSKRQYDLLFLLASSPDKIFSKDEIIRVLWKDSPAQNKSRTLDVHISEIRNKLGLTNIKTVLGYKFDY